MTQINLRNANPADVKEIAHIFRVVRKSNLPYLADLHTPKEDIDYFANKILKECEVWVAVDADRIVGFCAFKKDWFEHLYVLPEYQGKGLGTMFLNKAKEKYQHLQLWVFQKNESARKFYESHGFVLVETTDGVANEEKEPDARYIWTK